MDLAEEIRSIAREFASRLPTFRKRLRDASAAMTASPPAETAPHLAEMEAVAHALTGSAATFGFPEITRLAEPLERRLGALRRSGSTETDVAALQELVDALDQVLDDPGEPAL